MRSQKEQEEYDRMVKNYLGAFRVKKLPLGAISDTSFNFARSNKKGEPGWYKAIESKLGKDAAEKALQKKRERERSSV